MLSVAYGDQEDCSVLDEVDYASRHFDLMILSLENL